MLDFLERFAKRLEEVNDRLSATFKILFTNPRLFWRNLRQRKPLDAK